MEQNDSKSYLGTIFHSLLMWKNKNLLSRLIVRNCLEKKIQMKLLRLQKQHIVIMFLLPTLEVGKQNQTQAIK